MMNEYMEIEMTPTAYGIGGSFSAEASFCLDNFKAFFVVLKSKLIRDVQSARFLLKD